MNTTNNQGAPRDKSVLLAGAFGGMFPVILPFAFTLSNSPGELTLSGVVGILTGAIVLALIGCGLVWAQEETNKWKSFLIGLSLPSFISSSGQFVGHKVLTEGTNVNQVSENTSNDSGSLLAFFVSMAYAQPAATQSEGTKKVAISLGKTAKNLTVGDVDFLNERGEKKGTCSREAVLNGQCDVPNGATKISVVIGKSKKPFLWELNPTAQKQTYEISKEKNFKDGILSVFGIDSSTVTMTKTDK